MIFKNSKIYDVLKYLALICLDAVGLAYEELSAVWNLPYGEEVYKTCTILAVLLGSLVGVSSIRYKNLQENEKMNSEYEEDEV